MVNYAPTYRQSKALVIGINAYADDKFPVLMNAEQDAKDISNLLQGMTLPFKVDTLLGEIATREEILSRLYDLRSCDQEDRLIIYFAGHGFFTADKFGDEIGYIAAYDTDSKKEFTAINLSEILDLRLKSEAKHIGFIFDSCFSGQALGLTTRSASIAQDKFLERRAYQIITAGAGDQTVLDVDSLTQSIIQGLRDGKAEQDGLVTFSSLGLFLKGRMASQKNRSQIPQFGHLDGSQGGEIVLSSKDSYTIIGPLQDKTLSRIDKPVLQPGQNTAEVDTSGRIEDVEVPTTATIFAGLHFSLLLPPNEKKKALKMISKKYPKWGELRCRVCLYSLLVFYLIRDHVEKMEKIVIDREYKGYSAYMKGFLLRLLRENDVEVKKEKLVIMPLDRESQAIKMSSKVYRGDSIPDWIVSAEEIVAPIIKV